MRVGVVFVAAVMTWLVGCGEPSGISVEGSDDPTGATEAPPRIDADGLVAFDPFERSNEPPPPVVELLELPTCADPKLDDWVREVLEPYGGVDAGARFEASAPSDVIDTTPIVRLDGERPSCLTAGHLSDVEAWELQDADGSVLARGAGSEARADALQQVHERQNALGGINFGQSETSSQQHAAGVWFGDRMELELSEIEPRRTALLVVEWPSPPVPDDSVDGQIAAETRAGRLTTLTLDSPSYYWPLPLPRRLPPGFGRCAGPYPVGFHAYTTELCSDHGDVIYVSTDNEGANPVPDPPYTTRIEQTDSRLKFHIDTPVENAVIDVPHELGRDTLEAMAATVPLLDRRAWFPSEGRPEEFVDDYSRDWWEKTLRDAGASQITITEQALACPEIESDDCERKPGQPVPFNGAATTTNGHAVEFHVYLAHPDPSEQGDNTPGSVSRVVTVGNTDVLIEDGYAPGAQATCGGVWMLFRPQGVGTTNQTRWDTTATVELISSVLEALHC